MVDEMNTKNYTEDKFDKIFLDAKDKNVAKIKLYAQRVGSSKYKGYYDKECTKELTADDLEEAFIKGCIIIINEESVDYAVPTRLYKNGVNLDMYFHYGTAVSNQNEVLGLAYIEV